MDILEQTDLQKLLETSGESCVSMYLPTHKTGREQQQDPIRFKNLYTRAQDRLLEHGLPKSEVQDLLSPAENLLEDEVFWQHQSKGLAVFLSPDLSQVYRLPSRFKELLAISQKFHLKPLLPLLNMDGKFYILALSVKQVRLFLGTRDAIDQIHLGDVPTSMQEALWMDDPEKHVDFHTGASSTGRGGSRRAAFHGHGGKEAEDKNNLLRYFQRVDQGLNDLLEDKSIPMILAGVDYLLPIYQQVNSYPGLLEEGLKGNPDDLDGKDLHEPAWELARPVFRAEQKQAFEQFKQLHGQGNELVSTDLETIVKAAKHGRVEALFVPLGVQRWGRYDAEKDRVIIDANPNPENEDLLDFAAMHTLSKSGKVYIVQLQLLPGEDGIAAILRYTF